MTRFCFSLFFALAVLLLHLPLAHGSVPAPLSRDQAASLASYLDRNASSPEDYVAGKFRRYDVVLLGEDHRIKQDLEFVQRLIPVLHRAGVYAVGMEFGASEDQPALDSLVTGEKYDEAVARRIMFDYDVGWAFREYMDVYRAAWELNHSLPLGARRFRIVNLSYKYDWRGFNGVHTPANMAKVFSKGNVEAYRANLVRREILDRPGEKMLVLTGTLHAFTRYRYPAYDSLADGFYRLEDRNMGNLLYADAPSRVFFICLHRAFFSRTGGDAELIYPAHGAIDQVMALRPGRSAGFDLPGTPFGDLPDNSYYSIGHPDFRLKDLADGYIYLKPFGELEGCTIDPQFLTQANWPEASQQIPGDLDSRRGSRSLADYLRQIRDYDNVPELYSHVH